MSMKTCATTSSSGRSGGGRRQQGIGRRRTTTKTTTTKRTRRVGESYYLCSASESASTSASASASASSPSIEDIDEEFGISGAVSFAEDSRGMPVAYLTHNNGASVVVQLCGAWVSRWTQDSGYDICFQPPSNNGAGAPPPGLAPPEGGIHVCFPRYENGFASRLPWDVLMTTADVNPDDPEPSVTLVMRDSEASRAMWPHAFTATYTITLQSSNRLKLEFAVRNDGAAGDAVTSTESETQSGDIRFSAAVMGDFEVLDVSEPAVRILGVQGCDGLDLNEAGRPKVIAEDRDQVCFMHGPLHNLYVSTSDAMLLEVGTGATIRFQKNPEWREWFAKNHITNEVMRRNATSSKEDTTHRVYTDFGSTKQMVSSASDAPQTDDLERKSARSILMDETEMDTSWKQHISIGVGRCVAPVTLKAGDDWAAEFVVSVEDYQYQGLPDIGTGDALKYETTPVSGIPENLFFKLRPETDE